MRHAALRMLNGGCFMRYFGWIVSGGLIASPLLAFTVAEAGDLKPTKEDLIWQMPAEAPYPADNKPTPERIDLGKKLFFDPRLSKDGDMSCASCHNPALGWSDALPTARGFHGKKLDRATPSIYNAAFNSIQMWDGRKTSLEDQATGPMDSPNEMASDYEAIFAFLNANASYRKAFDNAYPGDGINKETLAKAIASFERTVVSDNSPFDRWLRGEPDRMTAQQIRGFRIFTSADRGHCSACHQAPYFTDNGFHNIGLASFGADNPDLGRYTQKPIAILKGAFKTPGLRNVARTAPYFHDGSASTLMDVVEHYARGGAVKTNLSPEMKPLNLSRSDKEDLVAFLQSLTNESAPVIISELP